MADITDVYIKLTENEENVPKINKASTLLYRPTGESIEETLIVYNQILSTLERQIDDINVQIDSCKDADTDCLNKIVELGNKINEVKQSYHNLVNNYNTFVTTTNTSISTINSDITNINTSISSINSDIVTINNKLDDLPYRVYYNIVLSESNSSFTFDSVFGGGRVSGALFSTPVIYRPADDYYVDEEKSRNVVYMKCQSGQTTNDQYELDGFLTDQSNTIFLLLIPDSPNPRLDLLYHSGDTFTYEIHIKFLILFK